MQRRSQAPGWWGTGECAHWRRVQCLTCDQCSAIRSGQSGEREGGKVSSEVTGLPSAGPKLPSSVYSYLQSMSQLQLRLRMQLPQPAGDSMSLWDRQAGSLCCPGLLLPHGSQCSQAAQEFQGGKRRLCELRPTLRWDRRNHLYSVSGD